jgi:hypothetical protein
LSFSPSSCCLLLLLLLLSFQDFFHPFFTKVFLFVSLCCCDIFEYILLHGFRGEKKKNQSKSFFLRPLFKPKKMTPPKYRNFHLENFEISDEKYARFIKSTHIISHDLNATTCSCSLIVATTRGGRFHDSTTEGLLAA